MVQGAESLTFAIDYVINFVICWSTLEDEPLIVKYNYNFLLSCIWPFSSLFLLWTISKFSSYLTYISVSEFLNFHLDYPRLDFLLPGYKIKILVHKVNLYDPYEIQFSTTTLLNPNKKEKIERDRKRNRRVRWGWVHPIFFLLN